MPTRTHTQTDILTVHQGINSFPAISNLIASQKPEEKATQLTCSPTHETEAELHGASRANMCIGANPTAFPSFQGDCKLWGAWPPDTLTTGSAQRENRWPICGSFAREMVLEVHWNGTDSMGRHSQQRFASPSHPALCMMKASLWRKRQTITAGNKSLHRSCVCCIVRARRVCKWEYAEEAAVNASRTLGNRVSVGTSPKAEVCGIVWSWLLPSPMIHPSRSLTG